MPRQSFSAPGLLDMENGHAGSTRKLIGTEGEPRSQSGNNSYSYLTCSPFASYYIHSLISL
jgi:hypothetical protein